MEIEKQKELCLKNNSLHVPIDMKSKIGIAIDTIGLSPINGLRHPISGDTNGWFIWFGEEFSERDDFFKPICMEHAIDYLSVDIIDILCLEPGFRFLSANDYLDIWFDKNLLNL